MSNQNILNSPSIALANVKWSDNTAFPIGGSFSASNYVVGLSGGSNQKWLGSTLSNYFNANISSSPYTIGDLFYANSTTTIGKIPDIATGNVMLSGGIGVAPFWGKVNLSTSVSDILPIVNGGTYASSFTANQLVIYDGTSLSSFPNGTDGQILTSTGVTSPLAWASITTAEFSYGVLKIAGNGDYTNFAGIGSPQPISINASSVFTDSSSLINFELTNPGLGIYGLKYIGANPGLFRITSALTILSASSTPLGYVLSYGYESGSGIINDTLSVTRTSTTNASLYVADPLENGSVILNPGVEIYIMASATGAGTISNTLNIREGALIIQSVLPDTLFTQSTSTVTSVNGQTGDVLLNADSIPNGPGNNLYASIDGGASLNFPITSDQVSAGSTNIFLSNDGGNTLRYLTPTFTSALTYTLVPNSFIIATSPTLPVVFTLPATCPKGAFIEVGMYSGSNVFQIQKNNSGQSITLGNSVTTSGGYLQVDPGQNNSFVRLICVNPDTDFAVFGSQGKFTLN